MIFYFSATGNSKYVAERIAKECHDMSQSIERHDGRIHLVKGEILGFVSPVYFWELPLLMRRFLENLQVDAGENPYVFFVATYGSVPGCCGEDAKKVLAAKNIILDAAFSVKMPDTWTPIFDLSNPVKVAKQNRDAEKSINSLIDEIQQRIRGNHTAPKFPYFMRYITDCFYRNARKTKYFKADSRCIGCTLCANQCPSHAIKMKNHYPAWIEEQCALCLRCLHSCPKAAIKYGRNDTRKHGQYRNPNTSL